MLTVRGKECWFELRFRFGGSFINGASIPQSRFAHTFPFGFAAIKKDEERHKCRRDEGEQYGVSFVTTLHAPDCQVAIAFTLPDFTITIFFEPGNFNVTNSLKPLASDLQQLPAHHCG